jgi:hypothetical protein
MYNVNEQLKDALTEYPDYNVITETRCVEWLVLSKVTIDHDNTSIVLEFG